MRVKDWPPHLLIIIALPFLLFWRWVFLGEVLYWGTVLFQFWPWHYLVKTSLLAGEWPLWDPLLGNGTPLLANLQSAVFYPPNLLYLLLPVEHGLTLSVILHLALAGLFMYLYTRHIGLETFGATLSALTYMLSGYVVGRTQFVPMVSAVAWIPVALLLCEKLAGPAPAKNRWKTVPALGVVLAVQLLAGHAQLWFYTLWLIGGYTVFRSWQKRTVAVKGGKQNKDAAHQPVSGPAEKSDRSPGNGWIAVMQAVWRLGGAVGLAVLLAAVQLLPTAEFVLQSPRQSGAGRDFALTYSFWPWRLITLLAPNFFGHPATGDYWGYANFWEDHAYVGILPFLLALTAVWGYIRNRFRRPAGEIVPFFAVLIPVSLILAMGWNTPVYLWLFDLVPGFGYFQAPARLLIWYTVAVAVLAGTGAQYFELTLKNRPHWRRGLVASLGIAVAGLAGSIGISGRSQTFLVAALTLGLWLSLAIGLLLAQPQRAGRLKTHLRWQWAVIGIVALNLVVSAQPLVLTLPAEIFRQPIASATFIKSQPNRYRYFMPEETAYDTKFGQFFRFDTFGPVRLAYWHHFREKLVPNVGVYAGLPSANNDDPLVVGRWQALMDHLAAANPHQQERLLQLMNVGYVVGRSDPGGSVTLYNENDVVIQRVADPLPEAYFVPRACTVPDEAAALVRLSATDFDSRQEVVIIKNEAQTLPCPEADFTASTGKFRPVTISRPRSGQVLLTVEAPQPGFVVLTDTFYPGWEATLDGRPVPTRPANIAFRAVAVEEAGVHTIEFNYKPDSFTIGLWLSGLTMLVVLAILFSDFILNIFKRTENSTLNYLKRKLN